MNIQQTFQLALRHHQAGRLPEAEALYRQILAAEPRHAESLHYLGIIACQVGRHDLAVDLIRSAISLLPDYPEAHCNLGNALKDMGRSDEAIEAWQRAVAHRPDYPEAHSNLSIALKDQGRLEEAIAAGRRAVELRPNYPEAHYNLANALKAKGHLEEAMHAYRRAIALKPDFAGAHNNLGVVLKDGGELDEAIGAYRQAIAFKPDFSDAHNNLGIALKDKGQLEEAIEACRRAIALTPNFPEAHSNLGNALKDKGLVEEAIASYRQAIALMPDFSEVHYNLGTALEDKGLVEEANAAARQAIALKPDFADAHLNLSLSLLLQGNFLPGWGEYEWRWRTRDFLAAGRNFPQPQWDGGPLEGRTILLHAEQGFGDTLQFIRYLPLAAQRGGRVIVECQEGLWRLLQSMGSDVPVLAKGQPLPAFDVHCPLLSLPHLFATDLAKIPRDVPYVQADAAEAEVWRQRLADGSSSLKVGLVWAGSRTHRNDRNRSLKLANFAPLAQVPGVRFVSLQKGEADAEAKSPPHGMDLLDLTEELKDFADTAALIAALDLVIAVDTSVVHLAGAMGKPVWVLLPFAPDWRWLLDRSDSPWYPNMRLFRQQRAMEWGPVIASVREQLETFVQSRDQGCLPSVNIGQTFQLALQHHQSGRLPQAEALYRQVLAVEPHHADALHMLGLAAHQIGRDDVAVDLIRQAIASKPDYPEAHSNLGLALYHKGQLDEAIAAYRQAIALKPNYFQAQLNLCTALQDKGLLDEAIDAYRQAIALKPDLPEAHNNLGAALKDKGLLDEAIVAYRQAIALKPAYSEAHSNLGNALKEKGQLDEAIATYRQAITLKPDSPEAHSNLGNALKEFGQLDEAIAACRHAIALSANFPEAHYNLGNALKGNGQPDEAIAAYRQAIGLRPNYPGAYVNLGAALHATGREDEAIAAYRQAVALKPDDPEAHNNLGLALLLCGHFPEGWEEHEWRWKCRDFPSARRNFTQPQWDGSPLEGRTILLNAEQGLGDTLQFIRYVPLVAQRGGRVIVECQEGLRRLLQTMGSGLPIVARGQPLPEFDVYCPLLSLPRLFATDLNNLPRKVPYLHAIAADAKAWGERLSECPSSLKVGLVWAGSPTHRNDRNRSLKLASLAPLAKVPGVRFISIQKGEAAAEAKSPPHGMELLDAGLDLKDFADSAALIAALDLVIAVDTSVVHLAGAMGKPVWVLLPFAPDWRWLLDRSDSPWYPTMRLFRQPRISEWDPVIASVCEQLQSLIQERGNAFRA